MKSSTDAQNKVLVVGIGDYTNIQKLDICNNDGKELYDVLTSLDSSTMSARIHREYPMRAGLSKYYSISEVIQNNCWEYRLDSQDMLVLPTTLQHRICLKHVLIYNHVYQ